LLTLTRSTHKPESSRTLPPKGTASPAEGAAENASSAEAVRGMKPGEGSLAGYLMAKAALHRKVEDPDLGNLRAGHETMQQVAHLLPLGRANVIQDIGKGRDAHIAPRHLAALALRKEVQAERMKTLGPASKRDFNRVVAASGQYAGTGTCHAYAASAAPLHAAKLADMRDERAIVALSRRPPIDHVWSEMIPKGRREDGTLILHEKDVIMDGWCRENLAILREDSAYARLDEDGDGNHLIHHDLLDHETGPEALQSVNALKAHIESSPALGGEFHKSVAFLVASDFEAPEAGLRNSETVFHAGFREQASQALRKEAGKPGPGMYGFVPGVDPVSKRAKHECLAEIQAVGVARSLGANIRGAKSEAPAILASAQRMFPQPKAEEAGFLGRVSAFFRS
jgi:hypothetical protein